MEIKTISAELLIKMFNQGTAKLIANKEEIDALNVFPVPDGDTGTNMSLTMSNAIDTLDKQHEYTSAESVAKDISKGSLMGARGNSGVILSQIFRGFYQGCKDKKTLDVKAFARCLEQSAKTAYKAVLKPVEGTILTVVREIGERAMTLSDDALSFHSFFEEILLAGEKSLSETPQYLPQLKQAGVVDAGGKGLLFIIEGFYEAVCGIETCATHTSQVQNRPAQAYIDTEDINFTYCTEFIVRGKNLENASLKEDIISMGDSMVYVPDEDLIKVHIHTDNPGDVMQKALKYGELIKIKIENMKEQHGSILGIHDYHAKKEQKIEEKQIGFVAVAMGEGMIEVLKDLGVDCVIEGGQTMNPSTADIQKAIESIGAKHVIVLPNNSNIILAANQAANLAPNHVEIIPSKSVVQGIAAMLAYDHHNTFEDNINAMNGALEDVKSLQFTYAVRDTVMGDVDIKKGDYLGIVDGEIVGSANDLHETILESLKVAIDDFSEIVSIYYGEDITEQQANMLKEELESLYPNIEIEAYSGKQPVYCYLISVE